MSNKVKSILKDETTYYIEEILPLIDEKNLYYIINLKLKRIIELYKDTVLYDCSYYELDSFEKSGYYESCLPILTEFMKCIDYKTNYR